MLTKIYFPEIELELEAWMMCQREVTKVLSEHKRVYKTDGADPKVFFVPFHEAVLATDRAARAFKQAVVDQARQHSSAEALWPRQLTLKHWKVARGERSSSIDG